MKVLFISLDTLRADRLDAMGYHRGLTPNLTRIGDEGALFTNAVATDIPTQPSHTALFTGRFGINTGIVSHFFGPAKLDVGVPWLPSILRSAGCATGAVDHLFAMKDWFVRGYDDYMPPPGRSRSPASVVNDLAFPWIARHREEDFFLFLHYWDAHIPYVPPLEFRERYAAGSARWTDLQVERRLRSRPSYPLFKRNHYDHLDRIPNLDYLADLYDAEVAYLDWEIGRLFDYLDALGILAETTVVLFADHGENMTEHDAWFDHAGLYESVVHVPLIIRAPGAVTPARIDAHVALVDVMPTVLEICGLPPVDGLDGRTLMPVIRGESRTHRDTIVLSEATWQAKRGIRTDQWKFIRSYHPGIFSTPRFELYDLRADPTEQTNVALDMPELVDEMNEHLEQWSAAQLAGRTDPVLEVLEVGLPAVARLDSVLREDVQLGDTVVAADAKLAGSEYTRVTVAPLALEVAGAAGAALATADLGAGELTAAPAVAELAPPSSPGGAHGPSGPSGSSTTNGTSGSNGHGGGQLAVLEANGEGGVLAELGHTMLLPDHAAGTPPTRHRPPPRGMNATPALRGGAPAHRRPHASMRQLVVAVLILVLAAQAAVVTWWALRGPSSYAGQVQAAHGVDLNFPTSGRLISVRVAPGDHVHRGETLARQDPAAAQSGLDAAQAVLAADQARLAALEAPTVGTAQAQQQALQVAQANAALAGARSALADARSVASDSVASAVTAVQSAQAAVTGEQSQLAVLCPNGVQPLPANPTPAELAQFTSCSNLEAQVQRDSSALAAAQANLPGVEAQAQQEVDRASSAVSASQVSLSLAQNQAVLSTAPASAADIAQAEAVVAADQAQIAADRQTLRSLTLVAPFDATVTSVGGASGDLAGSTGVQLFGGLPAINASAPSFSLFPQTPASSSTTTPPANLALFSLEEPRSHEVVAQVPEDDISKFTRGTRVHVAVNALGVTLGGRVLAVSATPLRSQGPPVLYQVAVRVHDAPRDMISGMSVAVRLDGR